MTFKRSVDLIDSTPSIIIKQMKTELPHDLLMYSRFQALMDYPKPAEGPYLIKGQIANAQRESARELFFKKYPFIFRELPWYECISVGDLLNVKFIEVVKYVGYDRIGDKLKVDGYKMDHLDTPNPTLATYIAGGRFYPPSYVLPALKAGRI